MITEYYFAFSKVEFCKTIAQTILYFPCIYKYNSLLIYPSTNAFYFH